MGLRPGESSDVLVESRWNGLLRAGAVAALLSAVLLVAEIAVYAVLPRSETAAEHLQLLADNWLAGLLTLDLLGVMAYLLFIPTLLALYVALHRSSEGLALTATVLFFIGIADFLATNTALPALALARDYAGATADADRTAILGAARAMFALFNENAFLSSYVIVSAAWGMIGLAMLRSTLFGRPAALAGVLTGVAGIAAVVLEHISATLVDLAVPIYFAAIVLLLAWMALIARPLWRLGAARVSPPVTSPPA